MDEYVTFVQWKSTDLCMDLICPTCKAHNHYDGFFAHVIRCGNCEAVFTLPTELPLIEGNTKPQFWTPMPGKVRHN